VILKIDGSHDEVAAQLRETKQALVSESLVYFPFAFVSLYASP
jgi:hypothetical protein